ncbi:MAG TPA: hypothetical protein PLS66_02385 [Tepiditoga sp.]|nr:hypothetical protein [Tepiditoga sp.]
MKKIFYFVVIAVIAFVFTGCMLKDNTPPVFTSDPVIVNIDKGINIFQAGKEILIDFSVSDNNAVKKISFFRSTDLKTPFFIAEDNIDKAKYSVKGYKINLPYDPNRRTYKIYAEAEDYSGNTVRREVGINNSFNIYDSVPVRRVLEKGVEITKVTEDGLYKIKFYFLEEGSGVKVFKISGSEKSFLISKKLTQDSENYENYYVVTNSNTWQQEGYVVFFTQLSLGDNNFAFTAEDIAENPTLQDNFSVRIDSPDKNSVPEINIDYTPYYVIDEVTGLTTDIKFTVTASDAVSNISKIVISQEGGSQKTVSVNPSKPQYSFEYNELGKISSEKTFNFTVSAYNTNTGSAPVQKKFSISVIKNNVPSAGIDIDNITKSDGNDYPLKNYIKDNNVFIEDNDVINTVFKAEDKFGIKNIVLESVKDGISKVLYEPAATETSGIKQFSGNFSWTIPDKGVYKLRLRVTNVNGRETVYYYPKDFVYSDESYSFNNMKLEVSFSYQSNSIVQKIGYKTVNGNKQFTAADGTKIKIVSDIYSKYNNIAAIYYILDNGTVSDELNTENYNKTRPQEWQSIRSDVILDDAFTYSIRVKIVDTFGKEFILNDVYYINVLASIEAAFGSKSKIDFITNNINVTPGDTVNIVYTLEDDFGLSDYYVNIYEVASDGSRVLMDGNPIISEKTDENVKSVNKNREWTPYKSSQYVLRITVKNILGITTYSESAILDIDNLYINIVSPYEDTVIKTISEKEVNFKLDVSGGASVSIFVGENADKTRIYSNYLVNSANRFSRYDIYLNLGMQYPDDVAKTGYVFSKPGDYLLTFAVYYPGRTSVEVTKLLRIRDNTDPIIENIKITSEDIKTKYPTVADDFVNGVYEKQDIGNDRYYLPVAYENGINETGLYFEFKIIDFSQPSKITVNFNNKLYEISSPATIDSLNYSPYEGKKRYYYTVEIGNQEVKIGDNSFVLSVYKDISEDTRFIKNMDIITLDCIKPDINGYSFDISDVEITKDQPSRKYFIIGNHNLIFNSVSIDDNDAVGGIDFNLYSENAGIYTDIDKSLYGGIRKTVSYLKEINMNNIKTAFGQLGLDISNFEFDLGIGYYRVNFTLYDKSYILGLQSSSQVVKDHINSFNKNEEYIYIYLTESVKAKSIKLMPLDDNVINSKYFITELEIKVPDSVNLNELIDKDSVKAELIGKSTVNLTNSVTYKGSNKYSVESVIQNNDITDGNYELKISFNTKLNSKTEEISKNVILDIDTERSLGVIDRSYVQGVGNAAFSIDINTTNIGNLTEDVKDSYFEYNLKGSTVKTRVNGSIMPQDKKSYGYISGLKTGIYELKYVLSDLTGKELSKTSEFTVESNKPTVENLTTDTGDRNRNIFAFNSDERFRNETMTFDDDTGLYKFIFEKSGNIFAETLGGYEKNKVFNVQNILGKLNDSTSFNDGESFTLRIMGMDINSNYFDKTVRVYRDITAPSSVSINNIPAILSNSILPINIDLNVKDNVAADKVVIKSLSNIERNIITNADMSKLTNVPGAEDWRYVLSSLPDNVDGYYTLKVTAEDIAGNSDDLELYQKIKIDTKKPVISFGTFGINNFDDIYYVNDNTVQCLTWEVSDFSVDSADSGRVYFKAGGSETNVTGAQKLAGSRSLGDLGITAEKQYDINFNAVDAVGLNSNKTVSVVYDKTNPDFEARTSGGTVLNSGALNTLGTDTVTVIIDYTENYLDGTNIAVNFNGGNMAYTHNVNAKEIIINNVSLSDTVTRSLTVTLTDKAGNSDSKSYDLIK